MQNSYFFMGLRSLKKIGESIIHKDYLYHLYELFSTYSRKPPVTTNPSPDKRTFASAVGGMQNSYFFMGLRSLKKIGVVMFIKVCILILIHCLALMNPPP